MTMIESVEIRNFQSHKHTVLEFIPGTNVIIGLSDAGKSAIFRAIDWVVSNRPLGDAYRSDWGGDTHVTLNLSDGVVVERFRSASKNEYRLNGEVLKAFGTEPPEEVTKALRMDSANVQAQGTPPFLLAMTPGEAARMLSKAASLDDIDLTISNLRRSQQETNRQLEFHKQQMEEFEDEFEQYEDLPELESRVEELESLVREYEQRKSCFNTLVRQVESVRRIQKRLEATNHISDLLERSKQLSKDHEAYKESTTQFYYLRTLIRQSRTIETKLEKTARVPQLQTKCEEAITHRLAYDLKKEKVTKLRKLVQSIRSTEKALERSQSMDGLVGKLASLETDLIEYNESVTRATNLKRILTQVQRAAKSLRVITRKIEQGEKEYHEIAPETCPLCGEEMAV